MSARGSQRRRGPAGSLAAGAVLVALGAVLSIARGAGGQADPRSAGGDGAPAEAPPPHPLQPTDLVTMDFQDVELPTLVKFVSDITGKNFLVDDKVKGKVTVISPTKITVDEAYRVFQSVLQVKGFTTVDTGPVVKIIPTKDIKESGMPVDGQIREPSDSFVTRVVPLRYVDATDAASVLQPLVSHDGLISAYAATNSLIIIDTTANLARLRQLIDELDVAGHERTVEVLHLHHAYATDLATTLRDAIEERSASTGPGAPGVPPNVPGVAGQARPSSVVGGKSAGRSFKILPDERSNTLVVIGSPFEIRQVKDLVAKLDVPSPKGAGRVNVYYLKYADATQLVQVLGDLVGSVSTTQRREVQVGRAVTQGGGRFGSSAFSGTSSGFGSSGFGGSSLGGGGLGGLGRGGSYGLGGQRSTGATQGTGGTASAGNAAIEFEGGVRVTADPATNSLVISASPQDYATLAEVIGKLDIPRRQVSVEALIFEVSLDRSKQLGIEFQGGTSLLGQAVGLAQTNLGNLNTFRGVFTNPPNPAALGISGLLAAVVSNQTITLSDGTQIPAQVALLSALQADTDVNVLSAPTIMATDNEEAEIVVGQNVPFVTSTSTNETNLSNTFNQIERRDVGITLRLTPQISEGDTVRLLLFQEVSDLVQQPQAVVNQNGPTTTVRSASTSVVVRDNETVAIGGLISDTVNANVSKVPYLGDIPVVGNFFRFDDKTKHKVNLIILLTPHIVKNANALTRVSDDERNRFREAMTGKGRFVGTQGGLYPRPPEPSFESPVPEGGTLLPAEGEPAPPRHDDLLPPEH